MLSPASRSASSACAVSLRVLAAAKAAGWLLGPFPQGALWRPVSMADLALVDWKAILGNAALALEALEAQAELDEDGAAQSIKLDEVLRVVGEPIRLEGVLGPVSARAAVGDDDHGAAGQQVRPLIGQTVQPDHGFDGVRGFGRQRHDRRESEQVGRYQVADVQNVALELLGIVHQDSDFVGLLGDLDAQCILDSLGRGQRVRD